MKRSNGNRTTIIAALFGADLRNIGREPMYLATLFAAPLLGLFARFALPPLVALSSRGLGISLSPHLPLLIAFLGLVPSMLAGFLVGFLLLDERDSGLTEYLAVTPLRLSGYAAYRLLLPALLGFAATILFFLLARPATTLPWGNIAALLPAACAAGLQGPWFALLLITLSANKVEGLAVGKMLGVFLLAPFLEELLPLPYARAAGILPQFWYGKAVGAGIAGEIGPALLPAAAAVLLFAVSSIPLLGRLKRRFAAA